MSRTLAWIGAAAMGLFINGCRSDGTMVTPADFANPNSMVDMAGQGLDGPIVPGDMGPNKACTTYAVSTIALMRGGTVKGCFELDNVVSIGTTPSTKSPSLFVQDSAGGDFSGIKTRCSSTSTAHPCTVSSAVGAIVDGRSVTIQGTYIKSATTKFEEFFIDSITDNGAGVAPPPATATLADIQRNSTSNKLAFQKVSVTLAAADALVMYDWTPAEYVFSGATKCPYQFGFGMLPTSVAGVTPGAACSSGTAQPVGQATPNPAEVLIDTAFYKGFTVTSDCRCAKMFSDVEPSAASTLSGTIKGLLIFDVPFMGTTGYMALAPTTGPAAGSDAPVSSTVPGM